jgi:hypothetical protein
LTTDPVALDRMFEQALGAGDLLHALFDEARERTGWAS